MIEETEIDEEGYENSEDCKDFIAIEEFDSVFEVKVCEFCELFEICNLSLRGSFRASFDY